MCRESRRHSSASLANPMSSARCGTPSALFATLTAPRLLVVYQDSRHTVGGVPATNLGPAPASLLADWTIARFAGKPLPSERWYVDAAGRVAKTALA